MTRSTRVSTHVFSAVQEQSDPNAFNPRGNFLDERALSTKEMLPLFLEARDTSEFPISQKLEAVPALHTAHGVLCRVGLAKPVKIPSVRDVLWSLISVPGEVDPSFATGIVFSWRFHGGLDITPAYWRDS